MPNEKTSNAWAKMVREIPEYQTAEPEVREVMEKIFADNDPRNVDAMRTFGDEAQAERKQVAEEILAAQEGEGFETLSEPLEAAANFMENFDLEGIGRSLATMSAKGVNAIRRNPTLAATSLALAWVAGPLALVGGGAAMYVKEKAKTLADKAKPETLEHMEERLREGIASFKPMVAEIEAAQKSIPAIRENIQRLGQANMAALVKTTVFIGAGREIERRADEGQFEDGDMDPEMLAMGRSILSAKIANLEQSRNGSIRDITILGNLLKAIDDNDLAIQSILTQEMHNHRSNLAAQKATADVLRVTRVIDEFRKRTEGDVKNAIKATDAARQLAAANRSDSPERLQASLEAMNMTKKLIEKAVLALPAAEKQKAKLREKLADATMQVVDAQIAYGQAANNNQLTAGNPAAPKLLSSGGPGNTP